MTHFGHSNFPAACLTMVLLMGGCSGSKQSGGDAAGGSGATSAGSTGSGGKHTGATPGGNENGGSDLAGTNGDNEGGDDNGSGGSDEGNSGSGGGELPSGTSIYVEAESIEAVDGWVLESATSDYSGSGYLRWTSGRNRKPAKGRLNYEFQVPKDGRYVITLRGRRDREGDCEDAPNDECNDVFTEINELGANKTMIKGSWGKWIWQSRAIVGKEDRRPAVYELKKGKNTLHLSGRSAGVKFDAFTVHLEGTDRPY